MGTLCPRPPSRNGIATLPALALALAPVLGLAHPGQSTEPGTNAGTFWCGGEIPSTDGGPEAKARRVAAQEAEVPAGVLASVEAALDWLARRQREDGSWSAESGPARSDVRATALALLALIHDGNTTREGRHKDAVVRGIRWLKDGQDGESGRLRDAWGHVPDEDHALGALALVEAYYYSKSPLLKRAAYDALEHALRTWEETSSRAGADQLATLAWIAPALERAWSSGLRPEGEDRARLLGWLDRAADPVTGRCGLSTPADPGCEAATAAALLARAHLVPEPGEDRLVALQTAWLDRARALRGERGPAEVSPWLALLGARALHAADREAWRRWQAAVDAAACATQLVADGPTCGSWPAGPRLDALERTAVLALALESHWQ